MRSRTTALVGIDTPFLIAHTVLDHPHHERAVACCTRLLDTNHYFALCPTVIDEFLHVVTDPKRFASPLSMSRALERARAWINSHETTLCFPSEESQRKQLDWIAEHRIGRKRINDTRIASIYHTHNITRFLTANVRDYAVFGVFEIVSMRA